MKNKQTSKRLLIYVALSYLLVWVPAIIYLARGGEYESVRMQAIMSYSMLCPSIAMLFTRWFTGEGFPMRGENSLGLGISFTNKKWIWYIVAMILPVLYNELGMGFFYLIAPESFDPAVAAEYGISDSALWMYPITVISSCCMFSIGALGEEAGWRGYMMPKLEELFGTGKAILIGGIIWGVWHFPVNMAGHNFGTGYWGEPWLGFVVFTLFTIFIGAILTYLTKKSGSVWPAAFMHAVNNGIGSVLFLYYNEEKLTGVLAQAPVASFIQWFPVLLLGIVAIVFLCRKNALDGRQDIS